MFKKQKVDPNIVDTVIGETTVIEGNIRSQSSVRIDGTITGDIESAGNVTIGEKGTARSNITAREVAVMGTVHGTVQANDKIMIYATGKLYGDINTKAFIIEEGASFLGKSMMGDQVIQEVEKQEIKEEQKEETEKEEEKDVNNHKGYDNSPL